MFSKFKTPQWLFAAVAAVLGAALAPTVEFLVSDLAPRLRDYISPPPPRRIIVTLPDYAPTDRESAKLVVERFSDSGDGTVHVTDLAWKDNSRIVFGPASADWYMFRAEAMLGGAPHRVERTATVQSAITEITFPSRATAQTETGWRAVSAPVPAPSPAPAQPPPDLSVADARQLLGATKGEGDRWLSVALLELGVAEIPGDRDNPRIMEYFAATSLGKASETVPWSGAFVSWVLAQAGIIPHGTGFARNANWLGFGTELTEPRRGAIVVLTSMSAGSSGQVGFLVERRDDCALVVAGNVNDRVALSCFPLSKVRSYRWPPVKPH